MYHWNNTIWTKNKKGRAILIKKIKMVLWYTVQQCFCTVLFCNSFHQKDFGLPTSSFGAVLFPTSGWPCKDKKKKKKKVIHVYSLASPFHPFSHQFFHTMAAGSPRYLSLFKMLFPKKKYTFVRAVVVFVWVFFKLCIPTKTFRILLGVYRMKVAREWTQTSHVCATPISDVTPRLQHRSRVWTSKCKQLGQTLHGSKRVRVDWKRKWKPQVVLKYCGLNRLWFPPAPPRPSCEYGPEPVAVPVPHHHVGRLDGGQVVAAQTLHGGPVSGGHRRDGGGGFLRSLYGGGARRPDQVAVLGHCRPGALQVSLKDFWLWNSVHSQGQESSVIVTIQTHVRICRDKARFMSYVESEKKFPRLKCLSIIAILFLFYVEIKDLICNARCSPSTFYRSRVAKWPHHYYY